MQVHDISMLISPEMPVYKGREEKKPQFTNVANHEDSSAYETELTLNLHTGTHLDAPLHMLAGGSNISYLEGKQLIAPCQVFDLTEVEDKITADDLKDFELKPDHYYLLKTKNSQPDYLKDYPEEFIYLAESGAERLTATNPIGVGIDGLGIERAQPGHPTHKQLLGAGIIIIEGLRLHEIEAGDYTLILAPLKIAGVEGAPARAFLLESTSQDSSS